MAFRSCRCLQALRVMPATRLGLTLRRGTDNNLAHVNIGGLLDREHDGAGDRVRRDPHLSMLSRIWPFISELVMDSVKSCSRSPVK